MNSSHWAKSAGIFLILRPIASATGILFREPPELHEVHMNLCRTIQRVSWSNTCALPCLISRKMLSSKALIFRQFGEPENVLSLSEHPVGELGDDEVLLKMCRALVHPSDFITIQGVYGIKPSLPAVGGNEGVGKVSYLQFYI